MSITVHRSVALVSLLGAALLGAASLVPAVAGAAPNYYSGDVKSKPSQLRVIEPRSGSYTAGDKIKIEWRKGTSGTDVAITVYTASGSGEQGSKVKEVVAPDSVRSGWKTKGGALYWTIPSDLPPGRYLVQVRSGSYVAVSDAFIVNRPKEKVPELGAEQLGKKSVVKKADVEKRGAEGSVVLSADGDETTYEWGRGACPELGGGLPGALAMMATLGDAQITPRYREAKLDDQVKQTCIVGLIAENKPVPDAD